MFRTPVFFTSVPKCGKNVIYSFFFFLGMKRYSFSETSFNRITNQFFYHEIIGKDNYVYKWDDSIVYHEKDSSLKRFISECVKLPENSISHLHQNFDNNFLICMKNIGITPIFVYRDPRACLISAAHYAFLQRKPVHIAEKISGNTVEEIALTLLRGTPELLPFHRWFDAYRGFLERPEIISVRFEDIIGPEGGGDYLQQARTFRKILGTLNITVSDSEFKAACANAFNRKAGTFRLGHKDAWKNDFTPTIASEFSRQSRDLPALWGYP